MTNEELAAKVKILRSIAAKQGTLSSFWDVIADAEAHLRNEGVSEFVTLGKTKIARGGASVDRDQVEKMVDDCLGRHLG